MKRYINLLPPQEQQKIKRFEVNAQVRDFGMWFIASLLIMGVFLFAGQYFLKRELNKTMAKIQTETTVLDNFKDRSIKTEVEDFNQNLGNFTALQKQNTDWSEALRELASILPQDMTIDRLVITRQDRKVEVAGHAGSRDSVLRFREHILESKHFVNINFPLSNLQKNANLPWNYRFYLKDANAQN